MTLAVDEQLVNSGWNDLSEDGMSTTTTAYTATTNTIYNKHLKYR